MKNMLRGTLVGLILIGCTTTGDPSGGPSGGTAPDSLDGRTFLSTGVTQDGEEYPLVEGTRIRLAFADGQLGASAGCNTIGGTYRIEDGALIFEGGAMTEMGCDPERHAQDDWLGDFLASEPRVTLDADDLTLSSAGVVITLLDREVADPDRPLTGTTWTVTSIFTGGAVSTVPDGATATFEFADDGTVSVNTGCNTGSGRYELDGDRLRFIDVAVTEMACGGTAGELESFVLPILGADELTIAIEASSLTMMAGDAGLGLTGS
jgi:heat shock protein HslJ